MIDILKLIGRETDLLMSDIARCEALLSHEISQSRFLVLGGAGTIGQAVTKEIFSRSPQKLHVVDISENNMVELVRDIRSSYGYIDGDFQTFALDIGSIEYDAFIASDGKYDYVLNLSALKHVRSEKDPFTLMRMIDVNILNTDKTIRQSIAHHVKKYFCVSTDKAANPVNMMGASKRIMELFLQRYNADICISTARFANVAFSDGSLLHGFNQRLQKRQPIVAPSDIKRYFVTQKEAGQICLMSCIFGSQGEIFFPKLDAEQHLLTFAQIAVNYLKSQQIMPIICQSEAEARNLFNTELPPRHWPCLFTVSDTTGEKDFEEFFTDKESVNWDKFDSLGIVNNAHAVDTTLLVHFETTIAALKQDKSWDKQQIVDLFKAVLPEFTHQEMGKYLDGKM